MIVHVFRKVTVLSQLLLVFIGILLWFSAFLAPEKAIHSIAEPAAPLFELIRPLLLQYPVIALITALILVIAQAFTVNHVATTKSFTDRFSLLPAILYLLLMSSTTKMITPHPVLFANLFLIPALGKLLDAYDEEHYMKEIFNIGFLIAMAGLFYYPAIALFIGLIISIFMYYIVNPRTLIAAFIGFLTPFVFLSIFLFLNDMFADWLADFRIVVKPFLVLEMETDIYQKAFIGVLTLLAFFAFFRLQVIYKSTKPIRIRNRITILLLIFIISAASFLLAVDHIYVHYGILITPLSIALAVFFYDLQNSKLSEVLFGVLLLLVIAARFASYYIL